MLKKFIIGTFVAFALLVGVTASAAMDFGPTTLKVGSRGQYVMNLQTVVGATPVDGIFGNITKAKVMAWQASNGLVADGLVGPATKNAMNAGSFTGSTGDVLPAGCQAGWLVNPMTGTSCTVASTLPAGCLPGYMFAPATGLSCTGATTPPVVVTGGAGTITAVETSTDVENYFVEGQSDVKVLGFRITANDSDAKVSNMKITLDHSALGGTPSTYLDRYVSDVSVWMNGSKIATIGASEFTRESSGKYSKSISLANAIVKEGTSNKATFYVAISGISNIDTNDMTAGWKVAVSDFRYQDGTGVIMSYPVSGIENDLTVKDINQTGDVKLVISKDSSNPAAGNVKVSDTGSTVVPMLVFKAKNTGASMTFDAMKVTVVASTNPVSMISELILKANGSSIATWTPTSTATGTITPTPVFDLDSTYTIAKDSTVVFTVEAKINDIDNFTSGALTVSYNDATTFEVASTRTVLAEEGAAAGETQTFFANGLVASTFTYGTPVVVTNTSGTTTSATYAISFKVSASGANYYVNKVNNGSTTGLIASNTSFADLSATGATLDGSSYLIADGDTATFTTTGVISGASYTNAFGKISLSSLNYGTTNAGTGSTYTFSPATSFETISTYFTD